MRSRLAGLVVVMVALLIGLGGALNAGNPTWQRALFVLGLTVMLLGSVIAIARTSKATLSRTDSPS